MSGDFIRKKERTMPELPEVETFKKYFDGTSLDQQIERVEVSDDKIIRNLNGDEFINKLTGRTFVDSYRRGKYLFARMDNDEHLLLHFGMTGDLNYYELDADRTKYERFVFYFTNHQRLGFDCPRKFARINYIENLDEYIRKTGLGPDALEISVSDFLAATKNRKATIKGFLLNQKILAGVGNLYADEVCYQTRIHPASQVSAIPVKKLKEAFKSMQDILNTAIERSAYYKEYPENWFWEWRKEGTKSPNGKVEVAWDKIGGRTTYYFPDYQRLYTVKEK